MWVGQDLFRKVYGSRDYNIQAGLKLTVEQSSIGFASLTQPMHSWTAGSGGVSPVGAQRRALEPQDKINLKSAASIITGQLHHGVGAEHKWRMTVIL